MRWARKKSERVIAKSEKKEFGKKDRKRFIPDTGAYLTTVTDKNKTFDSRRVLLFKQ